MKTKQILTMLIIGIGMLLSASCAKDVPLNEKTLYIDVMKGSMSVVVYKNDGSQAEFELKNDYKATYRIVDVKSIVGVALEDNTTGRISGGLAHLNKGESFSYDPVTKTFTVISQ